MVNSLEKIFLQQELPLADYSSATALQGEVFSLQLAYKPQFPLNKIEFELISELAEITEIRQVELVKADYFGEVIDKENVIDDRPGLYPDLLSSVDRCRPVGGYWQALWITLRIPRTLEPRKYSLQLKLKHENLYRMDRSFEIISPEFTLNVLPVELPEAELKITNWFYCDAICQQYNVEIWSERFFNIIKNYLLNMRKHGQNMIYVPMFTPPLDTYIGRNLMINFVNFEYFR